MRSTSRLLSLVALAAALVAGSAAANAAPARAAGPPPPRYYLALGDSLAAGYQALPGGGREEGRGYARDLADTLAGRAAAGHRRFTYVNYGCPGESTATMMRGGCPYPHAYRAPQLTVAEDFLRAHRADDVLVTLDIGANDVDYCAAHDQFDVLCAVRGLNEVGPGLDAILSGLRAAAGPRTRIVGMNLYDPVLARYILPLGQVQAVASVPLADLLNAIIDSADRAHGVPTVDVADAFDTNAFQPFVAWDDTLVPLNVSRIMTWTNVSRQDIHPNDTGYAVIARALRARLDAADRPG